MPKFRNVNSNQVVEHEDAKLVNFFRKQSRWEEISDAEAKPAKKATPKAEEKDEDAKEPAKATRTRSRATKAKAEAEAPADAGE